MTLRAPLHAAFALLLASAAAPALAQAADAPQTTAQSPTPTFATVAECFSVAYFAKQILELATSVQNLSPEIKRGLRDSQIENALVLEWSGQGMQELAGERSEDEVDQALAVLYAKTRKEFDAAGGSGLDVLLATSHKCGAYIPAPFREERRQKPKPPTGQDAASGG